MKTISSYVIKTFATAFWFDTINPLLPVGQSQVERY